MIYAYKLSLPFEFAYSPDDSNVTMQQYKNIDENLNSLLQRLELSLIVEERFFLKPGQELPIHVDQAYYNDYTKLNFIIGGSESCVTWYEPIPNSQPITKQTPIGTKYLIPRCMEDVVEVFKMCGNGPMIINPGHYHYVKNGKIEPRITYSFLLKNLSTGRYLQWSDAVEKFKDFIV